MQELQTYHQNWPELPYEAWKETYETLHMFTQIVGKISLALNPFMNHWWETAFLVTPRGLITYPLFSNHLSLDLEFNFHDHSLHISTSNGHVEKISLESMSVAKFHYKVLKALHDLNIDVSINPTPQEIEKGIPFTEDNTHHTYQKNYVQNFHRILLKTDHLMKEFRSDFVGKCSPVHFFWGSFDLAVSRFCGRKANLGQSDHVTAEAYSHELLSVGFWPGSQNVLEPAFYAYMSPEAPGYNSGRGIKPREAYYNSTTKGYILRYEDVRNSPNPDKMILSFFRSTYEVGANLGNWDRDSLEKTRQKLH